MHVGADFSNFLCYVLIKKVFDYSTPGEEMPLRMWNERILVTLTLSLTDAQDVGQGCGFIRPFPHVLSQESPDVDMGVQRRFEHQELRRETILERGALSHFPDYSLGREKPCLLNR
jgi:hypothetical protein